MNFKNERSFENEFKTKKIQLFFFFFGFNNFCVSRIGKIWTKFPLGTLKNI